MWVKATVRVMHALSRSPLLLIAVVVAIAGCSDPVTVPDGIATSPGVTAVPPVEPELRVWFDEVPAIHPSVDGYAPGTVTMSAPDGTRHVLAVRVASTTDERRHGLMEVSDLPDGAGMAFVFDADVTTGFWMKGTLIELDIVYIADDGSTVSFTTMTPCTTPTCPSYPPDGPYRRTVEVPGGFLGRIGFSPDWEIDVEPV